MSRYQQLHVPLSMKYIEEEVAETERELVSRNKMNKGMHKTFDILFSLSLSKFYREWSHMSKWYASVAWILSLVDIFIESFIPDFLDVFCGRYFLLDVFAVDVIFCGPF